MQLSPHLSKNAVRALRTELLESLTPDEFKIVECAASLNAHVFGDLRGAPVLLIKKFPLDGTRRRSSKREQRMELGGPVALRLVRAGWLRFSPGPENTNGYFWLTRTAETLWDVLTEKATADAFERRRLTEGL